MDDALTGEAQAAYLGVLMRQGSAGVDEARLRRDARAALCSRKHLNRLRFAAVQPARWMPQTAQAAWSSRAPRARVPRCRVGSARTRPKLAGALSRPGQIGTLRERAARV